MKIIFYCQYVWGMGHLVRSLEFARALSSHEVTLIDPREPGTATSFGNSGGIVTTSCAPLALPGTLKKVPGMLLDPLGPMVVRWRYLPRIAPWLWALVQASRPARVETKT